MDKMTFHVMIIPTLNCPSNCKYCWGSENTNEIMDISIIDNITKNMAQEVVLFLIKISILLTIDNMNKDIIISLRYIINIK